MLKNYMKIAFRSLYKNKLYSIINIVGLGVAIALCMVGYVNYRFSISYDSFHENKDNIYTVNCHVLYNDQSYDYAYSPMPMAPAMQKDIPGIEKYARISVGRAAMRHDDKVFNQFYYLVDKEFFEMLTFKFIRGDTDALYDRNGIVITDEVAVKYFGDENPIGQIVILSPNDENTYEFIVNGVIEQPPLNSSIYLSAYIPYERQEDLRDLDISNWDYLTRSVFIQINENASPEEIESRLGAYVQKSNEANPDFPITDFYLISLNELAYESRRGLGGHPFFPGMHPAAINAPTVAALLVLLLACFNFVNTSIAFAARRLKEIGIRKVIGGVRSQLIAQFLGENLVLCFIAMIVGAALAEIFVPAYDSLWPELSLTFSYSQDFNVVAFLVGLLLFTAVAAGAYPAFYISKFKPVSILKGRQKLTGSTPMIKILLTFQFAISITAIISAFIMERNADYLENMDLGFERNQVMIANIDSYNEYVLFKNEIANSPEIVGIGATKNLMGRFWSVLDASYNETKIPVNVFNIGDNYFETSGLKLLEGRVFDSSLISDVDEAIIVNEKLIEEFGWESALGKYLSLESGDSVNDYQIIGVVQDFYHNGLFSKISPTVIGYASSDDYRFMAIKYNSNNSSDFAKTLEGAWKRIYSNKPYNWFYMDDMIAQEARTNESIKLVFLYIAIMVVIISSMGLFALVSLNIAKRTKEVGIRKVLGANITNIGILICKEFVILLFLGSIVASIMAYFLVRLLLSSIWTYYAEFEISAFVLSALMAFIVAIITVSYQVYSAATANPVESIRDE